MHETLKKQLAEHGLDAKSSERLVDFLQDVSQHYQLLEGSTVDSILHAVINAIPGYVSWISADLHYLGVNDQLAKAFDLTPADFEGKEVDFLDAAGPFLDFLSTFVASTDMHQSKVIETEFGGKKPLSWYLLVGQKYNQGQNAVIIGIDVSELKRAEIVIVEQQQKMASAAKMAALGRMAAGIAHEINNPLTALMGNSSLLKALAGKDQPDIDRIRKSAEKIDSMVQRIAKIVKSCKQFSRDGSAEPQQQVLISTVLEDALELCRGRIRAQGVELSIVEFDQELKIKCRPVQISQVLLNFLNNSLDAIKDSQEKWIKIEITAVDQMVELAVVDSGKGLQANLAGKIFEPFYTTKQAGEGTGLGLNICRGIISEHQGEIGVDTDSQNTRFYIRLPDPK